MELMRRTLDITGTNQLIEQLQSLPGIVMHNAGCRHGEAANLRLIMYR
jgi:hypothetical protein